MIADGDLASVCDQHAREPHTGMVARRATPGPRVRSGHRRRWGRRCCRRRRRRRCPGGCRPTVAGTSWSWSAAASFLVVVGGGVGVGAGVGVGDEVVVGGGAWLVVAGVETGGGFGG